MTPEKFVKKLSSLQFEAVFNPYFDSCAIHDVVGAPRIRARILLTMLRVAVEADVDAIWIGRDLGYRGGRRTGLALTDDMHLDAHAARWGVAAERSTKGPAVSERTASVVWSMLSRIHAPVFLWNVFPLHPHCAGDPFTNRSHNSHERRVGEELLSDLIALLEPRRLIAVGNDAALVAHRLSGSREVTQIRHPSYGGQAEFLRQIHDLYELDPEDFRVRLI